MAVIAVCARPSIRVCRCSFGDVFVSDDDGSFLRQFRREKGAGAGEQVVADHDVVAGAGQDDVQPAGGLPFDQCVHDAGGGDIGWLVAAIHDDVGFGVDRIADLHKLAQCVFAVTAVEQRAVVAPGNATHQSRQGAAQPDGNGLGPGRIRGSAGP